MNPPRPRQVSLLLIAILLVFTLATLTACLFAATPAPIPTDTATPTLKATSTVRPTQTASLTNTPQPYRPITWDELALFLSDDHTNWNDYDADYYVCLDFSVDLVESAARSNLKAWVVGVSFVEGGADHAFVAFETSDYGIVYIEPQSDAPYWQMEVGQYLCDSWGMYECMGRVATVEYLQCDHAQRCTEYTP